jgi:hypothetical protein
VKFDNQHAVGISHHLHGAIGTEVVSLMGLHSTLPGLLGFARNDIPDRSFNRIGVPPPLQLSSLSPGAHALPVAWRWRIAEVTKNGLKSSTERGPLSFSSVSPPWVNRYGFEMSRYVRFSSDSDQIADVPTRRMKCAPAARETACETQVHPMRQTAATDIAHQSTCGSCGPKRTLVGPSRFTHFNFKVFRGHAIIDRGHANASFTRSIAG